MDKKEAERLQREMRAMTGGVPFEHWVVGTLRDNERHLRDIKGTIKWHWKSIAGLAAWLAAVTVYVAMNGGI